MRARVVVVIALAALVGRADALDVPIAGRKLKDGTSVLFTSKDPAIVPMVPGSADDPTLTTWTYEIFVSDPHVLNRSYGLSQSYWTPGGAGTRWRYSSPYASAAVRLVRIKSGALKVKIQVGDVPYGAGEAIAVVLRGGSIRYCAVFEPDTWVTIGPQRFVAIDAPAPAACPSPPGP